MVYTHRILRALPFGRYGACLFSRARIAHVPFICWFGYAFLLPPQSVPVAARATLPLSAFSFALRTPDARYARTYAVAATRTHYTYHLIHHTPSSAHTWRNTVTALRAVCHPSDGFHGASPDDHAHLVTRTCRARARTHTTYAHASVLTVSSRNLRRDICRAARFRIAVPSPRTTRVCLRARLRAGVYTHTRVLRHARARTFCWLD